MMFGQFAYVYVLLGSCLTNATSFFSTPYLFWFPIIIIASLAVITVLILIFMLAPLAGRSDIRVWVRSKIYDSLFTIILVFVFVFVSGFICSAQPAAIYKSVGLLPPACQPATNKPYGASINTFYGLALCNVFQFNSDFANFAHVIYYFTLLIAFAPGIHESIPFIFSSISFSFNPIGSIYPVFHYISPYMQLAFMLFIAEQMQLLLIAASPILFSIFMTVGLMGRAFGISRTFGGAMIAFGLGIGIVYPLLVTVSYGFITFALSNFHISAIIFNWGNLLTFFFTPAVGATLVYAFINLILLYVGFIIMGLTLIPLMNFIIVDTFIIDFSKAIGERMDFMSILTSII